MRSVGAAIAEGLNAKRVRNDHAVQGCGDDNPTVLHYSLEQLVGFSRCGEHTHLISKRGPHTLL